MTLIAGVPTQTAVAMSMVVVGGTSLLGGVLYWRKGNFHVKAAILFAATGMAGASAPFSRTCSRRGRCSASSRSLGFLALALVGMFGGLVVAERVPGGRLAGAFGWFVIVLALVIGGLVAAGVRITALT